MRIGFMSLWAILLFSIYGCRATNGTQLLEDEQEAPDHPLIVEYKSLKPLKCNKKKTAPLFKKEVAEQHKEIILKADHAKIQTSNGKTFGLVLDKTAETDYFRYIPIGFEVRGNSRRGCEWKPLRLVFVLHPRDEEKRQELEAAGRTWDLGLKPEDHIAIIDELNAQNLASDAEKAQFYYDKLQATIGQQTFPTVGFPQDKKSMFGKLGDDVKLVSHCGKAQWNVLSGPNYRAQKNRILQEFYIYRILNELKTSIIKTSLVEVQYHDDEVTTPTEFEGSLTGIGFWREPKPKLAKRCGLLSTPEGGGGGFGGNQDEVSALQTQLFQNFVVSLDFGLHGHNVEVLFSGDGKKYFSGYDFDLSGIIIDNYSKNRGPLANQVSVFQRFLAGKNGNKTAVAQVLNLLNQMKDIRKKIAKLEGEINADVPVVDAGNGEVEGDQDALENAGGEQPVNEAEQPQLNKRFSNWIDAFEAELKTYIENNRAAHGDFITAVEAYHRGEPIPDFGGEDPGQPAEGEGQPAEGEGQPAEGEGQPAEGEGQPAEGEGQPAEGEGQPAEGEGQPAEGEGQPAEGEENQPGEPG